MKSNTKFNFTFISQWHVSEVRQTEVWKHPHGLHPVVAEQLWQKSRAELRNYESLQENCVSKPGGGAWGRACDLKRNKTFKLIKIILLDCLTFSFLPWKNCPLRVLPAALDRANHTTVSAPWSTLRNLSPIIWWNWGIAVETAGGEKIHCPTYFMFSKSLTGLIDYTHNVEKQKKKKKSKEQLFETVPGVSTQPGCMTEKWMAGLAFAQCSVSTTCCL